MQKYQQKRNQIHGILVKNSDMSFQLKNQIATRIKACMDIHTELDAAAMKVVSEQVVNYLEDRYDGAWVCVFGKKFAVNVVHEPGNFMRASTEDYHIVVMKLKEFSKKKEKESALAKLLRMTKSKSNNDGKQRKDDKPVDGKQKDGKAVLLGLLGLS